MAWETLRSNDGIFLVNWEGLTRIIRSCKRAGAMNDFSDLETSEKHWIGPDLWSVEVNWDKVNIETTTRTELELRKFNDSARNSMQRALNGLVSMMEDADDARDSFQDSLSEAQHRTMENIESSVHKGEIGLEIATAVRDTSAEIEMVGATYLSGGAAIAVLGTGSAMKGAFVYQDTGKAGAAVATFGTNLVLGVADLKVGAALKGMSSVSGKIGMAIVWAKAKAVIDVPKSLIEGKSLKQAVSGGAVKLTAATPGTAAVEGLKAVLGEEGEAWAIPVEVALNILQDKGGEALSESGEEKKDTKGPPAHLPHPHPNHRLMDAVAYDKSIIEQTAVQQIGSGPQG
jgi:hypothetical protein